MRYLFAFALVALLGAGCAPSVSREPATGTVIQYDATPGVNEANCTKSGGRAKGDACVCPPGYDPDPAGFCLDAHGRPGGAMAPKP